LKSAKRQFTIGRSAKILTPCLHRGQNQTQQYKAYPSNNSVYLILPYGSWLNLEMNS
jgi:hypothetical protein